MTSLTGRVLGSSGRQAAIALRGRPYVLHHGAGWWQGALGPGLGGRGDPFKGWNGESSKLNSEIVFMHRKPEPYSGKALIGRCMALSLATILEFESDSIRNRTLLFSWAY